MLTGFRIGYTRSGEIRRMFLVSAASVDGTDTPMVWLTSSTEDECPQTRNGDDHIIDTLNDYDTQGANRIWKIALFDCGLKGLKSNFELHWDHIVYYTPDNQERTVGLVKQFNNVAPVPLPMPQELYTSQSWILGHPLCSTRVGVAIELSGAETKSLSEFGFAYSFVKTEVTYKNIDSTEVGSTVPSQKLVFDAHTRALYRVDSHSPSSSNLVHIGGFPREVSKLSGDARLSDLDCLRWTPVIETPAVIASDPTETALVVASVEVIEKDDSKNKNGNRKFKREVGGSSGKAPVLDGDGSSGNDVVADEVVEVVKAGDPKPSDPVTTKKSNDEKEKVSFKKFAQYLKPLNQMYEYFSKLEEVSDS